MEHTLLTNGFLRCSIALTFDVLLCIIHLLPKDNSSKRLFKRHFNIFPSLTNTPLNPPIVS